MAEVYKVTDDIEKVAKEVCGPPLIKFRVFQ